MVKPVAIHTKKDAWKVPKPLAKVNPKAVPSLATVKSERLSFSFQYWKQIEHFGLGGKDPGWFVAFLERLRTLSSEQKDFLRNNPRVLRFHPIKWGQTNIPIKREDLDWLPAEFLDDPENDIEQFSISTGLGRVAGFQDGSVFYIVLIDPHHNLQPTEEYNFRVTPTEALHNELETVLANLVHIENSTDQCTAESCTVKPHLRMIKYRHQPHGVVYIKLQYLNDLQQMVNEGKAKSLDECIELAIVRKSFD